VSVSYICVWPPSDERFADDLAAHDGGTLGAPVVQIGDAHVVKPETPENRGVQIVNVGSLFDGAETDIVGAPDNLAGLDAAAGHPHTEPPRIVIAPLPLFIERSAPELS